MSFQQHITSLWDSGRQEFTPGDRAMFEAFKSALHRGEVRAAEPTDDGWRVNAWVKQGILLGFRMGVIAMVNDTPAGCWLDKDTYPIRHFVPADAVRIVPGGSSVREGAYIGRQVTMMPPMYVNTGAYVDDGTMIDSHALVGSCAQVGKRVHLSAGAQLGGVLEPIGATPVIIEDDVFVGGLAGVFEGVRVCAEAILAAGVILTGGTPVYDATVGEFLPDSRVIPPRAVVVPGTRPLRSNPDFAVACPIIVKYRDARTDAAVTLEDALR
ncbi:MAG: 2,3,4,5-tetrahydropyridine-2,6-dicarboxylate N-succinyltransferase [Candidatus Cloacimonetes bacterium]|nr:2,3,4,5-tetrahydropyridine-2,6-dicarboxylate N-succinyltransferase [Candidatus Cloacimonadota bacterium]